MESHTVRIVRMDRLAIAFVAGSIMVMSAFSKCQRADGKFDLRDIVTSAIK